MKKQFGELDNAESAPTMDRAFRLRPSPMKLRASPSGLHFFDRSTGWNALVEEIRVPAATWARAPQQVSIALTNACDLSCRYCYAPKTAATLDAGLLAGWLRELAENGCLGVGFGGGEPTLHGKFIEICRRTAIETDLAVTFTTHAHRITAEHPDQLKDYVHFIRVSMDGIGTTYERMRGRPFAELLMHLSMLREVAPFGINYVVNAETFQDLDAALELADEWGAREFLLLPEQPVGAQPGIDARTLCALRSWIGRRQGRVPLAIGESHGDWIGCENPSREQGLRAYAHIDANGMLKRSSYEKTGVVIERGGVMEALRLLESGTTEGREL
jgi:pyruvate-formate lyase-activating enzyme